jgi:hypothetical protein
MLPPGLKSVKKVESSVNEDMGFGNYDSSDECTGKDATPNISKEKVVPFLKFNVATADGAEVPKISSSSTNKKTTVGSVSMAAFEE